MIFFKDNAPHVEDYDKTQSVLIELEWLQKIFNVEMNRSVYDITSLGYQYYFAICMKIGYTEMFAGPTLQEGLTSARINADIHLVEEGYIIDGIDSAKLTPLGAEYLYVLTDSHGRDVEVKKSKTTDKNKSDKNKSGKSNMSKVLGGVQTFMKGMHEMSKMAQKYDKSSTESTKNVWTATRKKGKKSSYSRKSTSVYKSKSKNRKKYRKR
jgi:hypothetical protein